MRDAAQIFPWERDADLAFLAQNFSSLVNLKEYFKENGYTLQVVSEPRCCVDRVLTGGIIRVLTPNGLPVELWGQHRLSSVIHEQSGIAPTRINFYGNLVRVTRNPGRHVRNR